MSGAFQDNAGRDPVDWVNAALTWAQNGGGRVVHSYLKHSISNLSALVSPLPSTIPFVLCRVDVHSSRDGGLHMRVFGGDLERAG